MWRIKFEKRAEKQLKSLDRQDARRILQLLSDVSELDNPRVKGAGLTQNLRGYWKYRAGDYRVIADIVDSQMTIIAVEVGHRSTVYKAKR